VLKMKNPNYNSRSNSHQINTMSTKNMPAATVRSRRFSLPKKLAFLSLVLLGSTATVGCNALTSQVPGSSNAIKPEPASAAPISALPASRPGSGADQFVSHGDEPNSR
jgi:hypothetical protein